MTNGDKKYIGNGCRWGLFGICWLVPLAAGAIALLIPDKSCLKYSAGEFSHYQLREAPADKLFYVTMAVMAVLFVTAAVFDLLSKRSVLGKVGCVIGTALLCGAVFVVTGVCVILLLANSADWFLPFGGGEQVVDGHRLVLTYEPHGMHHYGAALYEIVGEDAYWLGGTNDLDPDLSQSVIEPAAEGFIVYYTCDSGGAPERRSFTAKRREQSE